MAVKCHKKRPGAAGPASKISLLVGLAGSFSSSSSSGPGEGFPWSPTQSQRSPRTFAHDGAVGLGIVAAMNGIPSPAASHYGSATVAKPAAASRSAPIPIVAARPASAGVPRQQHWSEEEDMDELSESYTCVTFHVGGDAVKRRVYLDVDDGAGDHWGSWFGVFSGSPPSRQPAPLPVADFLSRCFRCSKRLHGLDVFMYGGDKAFCSEECRCQQMAGDGHREQLVSGALKPFDCSLSPCSTPLLLFPSGVAAA